MLGFFTLGAPAAPPPDSSPLGTQHPKSGFTDPRKLMVTRTKTLRMTARPCRALRPGQVLPRRVPSRYPGLSYLLCQVKGLPWMVSRALSGSVALQA